MTPINLQPIHVIGMALSVIMFYQSFRLIRKRKEGIVEFLLWTTFGIILFTLSLGNAVTILGVFETLNWFLGKLGFGSGTTGLLVLSVLALLMMLFYTFVKVRTNRKYIYDLNQKIALAEFENDDK